MKQKSYLHFVNAPLLLPPPSYLLRCYLGSVVGVLLFLWFSVPLVGQNCVEDVTGYWPENQTFDCGIDATNCVPNQSLPLLNCALAFAANASSGCTGSRNNTPNIECDCACKAGDNPYDCTLLPDMVVAPWDATNAGRAEDALNPHPGYFLNEDKMQLRIATNVANIGLGPIHIESVYTPTTPGELGTSRQIIWKKVRTNSNNWEIQQVPGNDLIPIINHPEHRHLHVADWLEISLWSADRSTQIAGGTKLSFCLASVSNCICQRPYTCTDINSTQANNIISQEPRNFWENPANASRIQDLANASTTHDYGSTKNQPQDFPNYGLGLFSNSSTPILGGCGTEVQGIVSGFSDIYGVCTPGNFINLPCDLPFGDYYVKMEVNPEQLYTEENYDNNVAWIPVNIDTNTSGSGGNTTSAHGDCDDGVLTGGTSGGNAGVIIWSFNNRVDDFLRVTGGKTFKIENAHIEFVNRDAGIEVCPTCVLEIDNSTLTAIECGDGYWRGIVVKPGGRVLIKNSSVIEKALIAISADDPDVVSITNSTLKNNEIGLNITNMSEDVAILNTEFIYEQQESPFSQFTFADINNAHNQAIALFSNCSFFSDLSPVSNPPTNGNYNYGIKTTDAYPVLIENTFHDLDVAVQTASTAPSTYLTEIGIAGNTNTGNVFYNNWISILSMGDKTLISNNVFQNNTTGIYLENTAEYLIENNAFSNSTESIIADQTGTINTTLSNQINHNTFSAATGAIAAIGNNDGLKITCNDMNQTDYDITVERQSLNAPLGTINELQANPDFDFLPGSADETSPASNKFSTHAGGQHFFIEDAQSFRYLHHTPYANSRYIPDMTKIDNNDNIDEESISQYLPPNNSIYCNTQCFPDDGNDVNCVDIHGIACPTGVDECGECGGSGIPASDCDCNGNVTDQCGTCGGSGIPSGHCDCNGNTPSIWYLDADGDGKGNPSVSTSSCTQPNNYVSNNNDSDDSCNGTKDECGVCNGDGRPDGWCSCTKPPRKYYADTDGDGLGDPDNYTYACSLPNGYVTNRCDKNDNAPFNNNQCALGRMAYTTAMLNPCPIYANMCLTNTATTLTTQNWPIIHGNDPKWVDWIQNKPTSSQTINGLRQASPYLSDEALIALVQQTAINQFAAGRILAAHAPLTNEVEQAIKTRQPAFSPLVLNMIYQAGINKPISDRKLLEMKVNQLTYKLKKMVSVAVNYALEEGHMDEALDILSKQEYAAAKRQHISLLIQKGDYTKAKQLLKQLPSNDADQRWFKQLQAINIQVKSSGRDYTKLSKRELAILNRMVRSQTTNVGHARAILQLAGQTTPPLPMPIRKRKGWIKKTESSQTTAKMPTNEKFQLYPNPTQNTIHIELDAALVAENLQLIIYDPTGRFVQQTALTQLHTQLDVNHLANGIYLYHIKTNEAIIGKDKLLIIR